MKMSKHEWCILQRHLSQSDYKKAWRFTHGLLESSNTDELIQNLCTEGKKLSGFEAALFVPVNSVTNAPLLENIRSFDMPQSEKMNRQYLERYTKLDNLWSLLNPKHANRVFRIDDVEPMNKFLESEFYCDFFRPSGLKYAMAVQLSAGAGPEAIVAFQRASGGKNYTERDKARLQLVAPMIAHSYQSLRENESGNGGNGASGRSTLLLTPRENEVSALVCRGHTNNQIGKELGISSSTVKRHLGSVFEKQGVSTRSALVASMLDRNRGAMP